MTTIKYSDIVETLSRLIDEEISREEASQWAVELQIAEDENRLIYSPKSSEKVLRESIHFIHGIDMKVSPKKYLNQRRDIEEYLDKLQSIINSNLPL